MEPLTPIQNFENHMTTYAESKGFVINSHGSVWKKAKEEFLKWKPGFQALMNYEMFQRDCLRG